MTTDTDVTDERIEVCVRTAGTGHMTLALPLAALPAFVDEHLAAGRAVIAEYGAESLLIRIGREILDFFGLRRKGAKRVTVANPMRGGVDVPEPPVSADMAARVLAAALQARNGGGEERQYGNIPAMATQGGTFGGPSLMRGMPLNAEAEMRAWQALCDKEGEAAALSLTREGAIAVRSALWQDVLYLVKLGTIQVIRDGQCVSALCLQLADGGSVWDAVANRLSLLRAGESGEIHVWATANAVSYR